MSEENKKDEVVVEVTPEKSTSPDVPKISGGDTPAKFKDIIEKIETMLSLIHI